MCSCNTHRAINDTKRPSAAALNRCTHAAAVSAADALHARPASGAALCRQGRSGLRAPALGSVYILFVAPTQVRPS